MNPMDSISCGGVVIASLLLAACGGGGGGVVDLSPAASAYSIGGTVTGLGIGKTLVLRNNGGNDLTVNATGTFTFGTAIASGATYNVTITTQPVAQTCSVGNASGTMGGANVTNVSVSCATIAPGAPVVTLGFGLKQLRFSWPAVGGATSYRVFESPEVGLGYTQLGSDLTTLLPTMNFNHTIPVHRRLGARYYVEACNAIGCTPSGIRTLTTADLTQAIGYVKALNTVAGQQLGYSVAVSGDGNTLAVGAPGEGSNAGAVIVFTRDVPTTVWTEQLVVRAANAQTGDAFGTSVALSNDGSTLAVGAPGEDSGTTGIKSVPNEAASNAGAAYVFTRNGGGIWAQQAYVKASNSQADDRFGAYVALSGDGITLAVGASGEDSGSTGVNSTPNEAVSGAGAVYVFTRGASWSQQAYVKASNPTPDAQFGKSMALSANGDTLAVGAIGEDGIAANAGAVYVFTRTGTTWTQQALVKALNAGVDDAFGGAVSLSSDGNTLAVGATEEDSSTTGINTASNELAANAGAVYVFTRMGAAWTQQAYVKASNAGVDDRFGASVTLSGDGNTLAVGAIGEDSSNLGIGGALTGTASNAGAVYVFNLGTGGWLQKSTVKASNTGVDDNFGYSVTLSSDGNTLAVGAIGEDGSSNGIGGPSNEGASGAGAVYLY